MTTKNIARAVALALIAAAPAAQAQMGGLLSMPHVAVGVVGSTLGLGGDVAVGVGRFVVVRASQHAGSLGVSHTFSSQAYEMFAKADNRSFMLDIHPFGGGIYVSAGKVINKSTIALTGTPTNGTYTFNGQSYAADSVGSVVGAITLPRRRAAPGQGLPLAERDGPLRPGVEPGARPVPGAARCRARGAGADGLEPELHQEHAGDRARTAPSPVLIGAVAQG